MSQGSAAAIRDTSPPSRGGGAYERVTVNLTRKTSVALAEAVELSKDSKTDTINKALQLYALLYRAQQAGGGAYMKEKAGGELERLRLM